MPLLNETELADGLAALPGWHAEGGAIVREFRLEGGFMGSVRYLDRLARAAEALNHHPDIAISWDRVTVTISSHQLGGVTDRCLELAAEADRLAR